MATELKPCPFCGSEHVEIQKGIDIYMVLCHKCGATVSFYKKEKREQSFEAWNRRTETNV